MIRWIPFTFVRTTFFLIAGILIGDLVEGFVSIVILNLVLGILSAAFILLSLWQFSRKRKLNTGYMALPLVAIAGAVLAINADERRETDHIIHFDGITDYRATIVSFAEEKTRTFKVIAEVDRVFNDGEWHRASGKVLLYLSKDTIIYQCNYGDMLLVHGRPTAVPGPGNPHEFDYRKFLSYKQVYHQQFVKPDAFRRLGSNPPNTFQYYALQCRLWSSAVLERNIPDSQTAGIALALVLGVTDSLDPELMTAYAATGTTHVLAVSGLHVSILYLIILFFFKPLDRSKKGKLVIAILSLFVLWGYAFVTGLSPSVLRAVTMFTFIAIAKATGRSTNIYNTLAASAFCLLLFDPYLIMSVGFQLSYLAVAGIVYIQPLMARWWEPRAWLTNEIWKLTTVSVAAQLATMSLSFLYFHQFPNYFLISNLIVIPLSFVVLILGIALLALSWLPVIPVLIGKAVHWLIAALNGTVQVIEWLPYSVIDNIRISPLDCFLLMVFIVSLIVAFEKSNFRMFRVGAAAALAITCSQWMHEFLFPAPSLTVYRVNGSTAIDFFDNGSAFFLADEKLMENARKIGFHILPNRVAHDIVNIGSASKFIRPFPGGSVIRWKGITLVHISTANWQNSLGQIAADLIVIGNQSVDRLDDVARCFPGASIVIDSSNPYYYAAKLLKQGEELPVSVHSVLHGGAFSM